MTRSVLRTVQFLSFGFFKTSVQNCKILENKLEEKHHDNVGRNRNRNLGKF